MGNKNIFKSPWGIYLLWILLFILYFIIVIPITVLESQSSSGLPFIFIMYGLSILILGVFVISLLIPLIFRSWFKKFWYVDFTMATLSGYIIVHFLIKIITT